MSATTQTEQRVETVITDALRTMNPDAGELRRDATWEDLDVDSLDLAELAQIVEDELGVKLSSGDVAEIKTVGQAIDTVVGRMA
jgi:acyl carrier protein